MLIVLFPLAFLPQSTERVSLTPAGGQIDGASNTGALSGDGRHAVFTTSVALVALDTNNREDVYVRDRVAGTTTLVSLSPAGTIGNRRSANPDISADGRYVVFDTESTDYVVPDANGLGTDVWVRDLQAGTTTLVSRSSAGVQGNAGSGFAAISADGRYVAFESGASNLVAGDGLGVQDVFRHDLLTSTTIRVSLGLSGGEPNSSCNFADISGDGRYVTYRTAANNIVSNDTYPFSDVFRYDTQIGSTALVSESLTGGSSGGDLNSISYDGQRVAFYSGGDDLVAGDTNAIGDLFVRDFSTSTTVRASLTETGAQIASGLVNHSYLSSDGLRLVFSHTSPSLVAGDTNASTDVFLRDLAAGTTTRVSVSTAGSQGNGDSYEPRVSGNGLALMFHGPASNLVGGDTNGWQDVFLRELAPPGLHLAKAGACPGAITLSVSGATPGGLVAMLYGPAGSWTKPNPPCAGLTLQLFPPTIGALLFADGTGGAALSFTAPVGVCGVTVQAVDVPACAATNALTL